MVKLIIDRFEGDYAVCEDENKNIVSVLKAKLPKYAEEGSALEITDGFITVDQKETACRKKIIKEKMDGLWDK